MALRSDICLKCGRSGPEVDRTLLLCVDCGGRSTRTRYVLPIKAPREPRSVTPLVTEPPITPGPVPVADPFDPRPKAATAPPEHEWHYQAHAHYGRAMGRGLR